MGRGLLVFNMSSNPIRATFDIGYNSRRAGMYMASVYLHNTCMNRGVHNRILFSCLLKGNQVVLKGFFVPTAVRI